MDAAWKRWLALAVLWNTHAAAGVCRWLQAVRANFGAMRSTAGLMVLMAAGVLAGRLLGAIRMATRAGPVLAE
ncbi:MAG: hypothetical protein IT436_00415 [Phycisphaerales bacterium]|nr:hypothetical protein [Phycisphaerales bacterium]